MMQLLLPTCSSNSGNILGSNKQVINRIHQMFDIYSSHVVVISIFSTSATLYRHKVVVPGNTNILLNSF